MEQWDDPMHRYLTVWVPLGLVILFLILIAIGAYYGSRALVEMVRIALLIIPIIGLAFLLFWILYIPVLHHVSMTTYAMDPSERIEDALSQANIDHTKVPRNFFLGPGGTLLLPDDMTIVMKFSSPENNRDYYTIYVGPLREDNENAVEGLKALVEGALG